MALNISSKNNDLQELEIVGIVKTLCVEYGIPMFTQNIIVEKGATPHSHPVLTLNTRVNDSRLVLKTAVHEQFHWYVQNYVEYNDCISYLK